MSVERANSAKRFNVADTRRWERETHQNSLGQMKFKRKRNSMPLQSGQQQKNYTQAMQYIMIK